MINLNKISHNITCNIFPTDWKYIFCELSTSQINAKMTSNTDDTRVPIESLGNALQHRMLKNER